MVDFQLDGAHPEYRIKIEGIIRGLLAQHPWIPLKIVRLYEPEEDDRSLGNADGPGEIALNAFWFADPPGKLEEAAQAGFVVPIGGQKIGWHGDPAWPEPDHLALHETWHVATEVMPGWEAWAAPRWLAATKDPSLAPSGYALAGLAEFVAEYLTKYSLGLMGAGEAVEAEELLRRGR